MVVVVVIDTAPIDDCSSAGLCDWLTAVINNKSANLNRESAVVAWLSSVNQRAQVLELCVKCEALFVGNLKLSQQEGSKWVSLLLRWLTELNWTELKVIFDLGATFGALH